MDALVSEHVLYEADFDSWCERQAAAARGGRFDAVDLDNVAEELAASRRWRGDSLMEPAFSAGGVLRP